MFRSACSAGCPGATEVFYGGQMSSRPKDGADLVVSNIKLWMWPTTKGRFWRLVPIETVTDQSWNVPK